MSKSFRLGVDIGSTTVKIAILDTNNNIVFSDYEDIMQIYRRLYHHYW